MSIDKILLGKIVGAQGLKGEVKIKSFTEFEEDIGEYSPLEDQNGKEFDIEVLRVVKGTVIAKIDGITDRTGAESLVGTELYADKDLLPELEDDEFYHNDLIGLIVKLKLDNSEVGTVAGLYNFGAGDILEIKLKGSTKTEMIPFTDAYVPEINIKDGYIIVETILLPFTKEITSDEG